MNRYNKKDMNFSQKLNKKDPMLGSLGRLWEVCDAENDASYNRNLLYNQYFKTKHKTRKKRAGSTVFNYQAKVIYRNLLCPYKFNREKWTTDLG